MKYIITNLERNMKKKIWFIVKKIINQTKNYPEERNKPYTKDRHKSHLYNRYNPNQEDRHKSHP